MAGASRVLFLFALLMLPNLGARGEEVKGLVTIGMQRAYEAARPALETAFGRTLQIEFASTFDIAKRVREGEVIDFVMIARTAVDRLVDSGRVQASDGTVLGGSFIVAAVPAGRPKPDVSTPEGLKSALLAANAVAYTDPASGGPSGIQVAEILRRLGVAEKVEPKTKHPPAGGFVGAILARGEADFGIQQATELSGFGGVEVIGPIPQAFQIVTEYAVAIPANAAHPETGKAVIAFLRSEEGAALLKTSGLNAP